MDQAYNYTQNDPTLGFEPGVEILKARLPGRVAVGWPNKCQSAEAAGEILNDLRTLGVSTVDTEIADEEYRQYLEAADYAGRYGNYYPASFAEKTLEHFLAYRAFELAHGKNFVDLAAEHSPHSEIFARLSGCNSFMQDIMLPAGIHGNRIGCDATAIPLPDQFFQAALLACSIEHFEGDGDVRLIAELIRLLDQGGKLFIVPLYIHTKEFCVTDPIFSVPSEVGFDEGADIHCVQGWSNRHGRFYSPQTLFRRLIEPNQGRMNFLVQHNRNHREIDETTYCRFSLLGTKL